MPKKYSTYFSLAFLILIAVIRFVDLDIKPTHFDEGVNGHFVETIKTNSYYDYNPENFHGPTYFYLLFIADSVFGSKIEVHRALSVALSLLGLVCLFCFRRKLQIGLPTSIFLGLSPAISFYARYSIHESLFASSLVLYSVSILLFLKKADSKWITRLFYLSILLMSTTKETFMIHLAMSFIPFIYLAGKSKYPLKPFYDIKYLSLFLIFFLFLYTNAFHDFTELKEFFMAYLPWVKTGVNGNGHEKAFFYFFKLLFKYEAPFILGFGASLFFIFKGSIEKKYLSIYALLSFLTYSFIPYKTPWCLISILWPFSLLADWFLQLIKKTFLKMALVLVSLIYFSIGFYKINWIDYANLEHPYAYVQTSVELKGVIDKLRSFAVEDSEFYQQAIYIGTSSHWPLPWLLKDFIHVNYGAGLPGGGGWPDIMMLNESDYLQNVNLFKSYEVKPFLFRDSQEKSVLLIEKKKQSNFLQWLNKK